MTDPAPSQRRILVASLVGTSIEFYDFYAYATAAALVFGKLFFPAASDTAAQLASFATIGVAFVARPLGSIFFGHFGDRVGRKSTLVAALLTMGLSTTLVAVLPTYHQIGWPAALLLCLLRFGQGFGLGGEWGGAALLAVENAPPGMRARYGMVPQLGAPIGFILANAVFLLLSLTLSPAQFAGWGWRLPFAFSAVLVVVGLWIRLKLTETPEFRAVLAEGPPPAVPIGELGRGHLGQVLHGTLGVFMCFVLYYVSAAFALSYGTRTLGYPMPVFLSVVLAATTFQAFGTALSGLLADRGSERKVMLWGAAGVVGTGFLMAPLMNSGSLGLIFLFLALALFLMGITFGPVGAWLPSLFPARIRYTGASIALTLSGVFGGSLSPIAAQALANWGGLAPVGLLMSGAGLVSFLALLAGRAPAE